MPVETVINLVDVLRQFRLLEADQYEEVIRTLAARFPEPKALAKDILQRGWLTPFQVNQIFLGRGQELVLGRYVLLDRLGEGGMGQVFRARQTSMGRMVALKVIRKDRLRSEQAARRFQREIQSASKLRHPNVVQAIDAEKVGDTHFFAMEYIEGVDLGKLIKAKGPIGANEACDYIRQAALGLQHAFEHGLIHRDIKPANLLLAKQDSVVKILDMGLVREEKVEGEDSGASTLTQENAVMGTPDYLAPEQARDAHNVDIRADLYSLGCTLYYLLSGRVPFPGGQLGEKLIKHQLEQAMPLRQLCPNVPAEVEEVAQRLMAKHPDQRYQTPGELAQALACLLSGERPMPAAAKPVAAHNPFVDLGGGDTLPSSDTSPPSRKIPVPERPSFPSTIQTTARKIATSVVAGSRWVAHGLKHTSQLLAPRLEKVGVPRDKAHLALFGGAGLCLFLLVGCWLMGRSSPQQETKIEPPSPVRTSPFPRSPLDLLEASLIANDDRLDWLPKETVAVVGELRGRHPGGMYRLALSPDGKILATCGLDNTIRLWDPSTRRGKAILKGHTAHINTLAFAADGKLLVSGSADRTIRFWHVAGFQATEGPVLKDQQTNILNLALSGNGKWLASGGGNKSLFLWDVSSAVPEKKLEIADFHDDVRAMALSADGKLLAAADLSAKPEPGVQITGAVRCWDLGAGLKEKAKTVLTSWRVYSLKFAREGKTLLAGGSGAVHVLNVDDDVTELGIPLPAWGNVVSLAFCRDEKSFAAAGDKVEVYKLTQGHAKHFKRLEAPSPAVSVEWFPDNKSLVSGHTHGGILYWESKGGVFPVSPLVGHPGETFALAMSPDGKYLATCGGNFDNRILLWSLSGPRPILTEELAADIKIHALAFAADGKLAAGGMNNGYVLLYDLPKKEANKPSIIQGYNVKAHGRGVRSLAFAPDGKTLVSGGYGEICTWDLRGALPRDPSSVQKKHNDNWIGALAFRPDGKMLASAGFDGQIGLWDVHKSQPQLKTMIPKAHAGSVTNLAFDSDNATLVSGGVDSKVRVWELKDARELKDRFLGHKNHIAAVDFSPQGHQFVSADKGGQVIVWDTKSSRSTHWQLDTSITAAVVTPDGRHVAIATGSSGVLILRLAGPSE